MSTNPESPPMPDMTAALAASAASEGTQPSAPASSPSPSPSPAPSGPAASGGTSAPAPAAQPAGAQPAAQPAAGTSDFLSVRDALRQYQFPGAEQFQDDHAALQQLILRARQAEQLQQMAQYGQLYLQHQPLIQQALQRQQEEQARQQKEQQQWFKAPEWDPAWRSLITKDPTTGELKPVQGAPPDIVQKYLTGLQHQQSFLEKFAFDPMSAIKPGIEQMVREMAGQIAGQQLGQYQEQSYAQQFVQQHSSWLFQQDANGQALRDPYTGQQQLSPWGQKFKGYMVQAAQMGIPGEQQRSQYAMNLVKGDYLAYQLQQQQAGAQNQQQKQQFLQGAQNQAAQAAAANQAPAAQNPSQAGATQAGRTNRGRSLGDRIKENFAKGGINLESVR